MPELPEVETIVRGLNKHVRGQKLVSVKIINEHVISKYPGFEKLLSGDTVVSIERHGKYMKLTMQRGTRVVIHLRMTGQLFIADKNYIPDKHVHVDIVLSSGKRLIYRDIRKFGRWTVVPKGRAWSDYINAGPDALTISLAELTELMRNSPARKLKAFLLDQTLLAGIGNIYADEVCFLIGVDPEIPVRRVQPAALHRALLSVLQLAIKHKGTSVSDYLTSTAARGNFQNLLKVYQQENCQKCGEKITRKPVAGRTSHVCPKCQKMRMA